MRLARLALWLATAHWDGVRDAPDTGRSAEEEFHALGFSDGMIEAFFRPFLAGIRLRRDLRVSAAVALFDLRMLLRGRAALPARGMRALPEALAPGTADRHCSAEYARAGARLRRGSTRRRSAHADGELRGSAVVLATDGDTTARLTGLEIPRVELGSATLYLAGQQRPFTQKLLVLNALPDPFVNDATLLTNIAPEYAPSGWHLLAAHVLDANDVDDGTVEARARADLQRWFPHVDLVGWRTLRWCVPRARSFNSRRTRAASCPPRAPAGQDCTWPAKSPRTAVSTARSAAARRPRASSLTTSSRGLDAVRRGPCRQPNYSGRLTPSSASAHCRPASRCGDDGRVAGGLMARPIQPRGWIRTWVAPLRRSNSPVAGPAAVRRMWPPHGQAARGKGDGGVGGPTAFEVAAAGQGCRLRRLRHCVVLA